ncbi:MAG: NTP transferase domain-containing protein [Gemmatimonadota bacterium]|nr:NTP transferase domain-containing protein [Gemmatimonadota bacterium]
MALDQIQTPRQTVILAAGFGSRLSPTRGEVPKPLVTVAGRTLLEHALGQAAAAGVEEAVVVLGNAADLLRAHLAQLRTPLRLRLVYNDRFHEPNGVSLLAAAPYITGIFYLQMVDHLFDHPVLRLLDRAGGREGAARLLVDFAPADFDEADATKVRTRDGRITAIGKDVYPYDAVDTGYFRLDPSVFAELREAQRVEPPSVTAGMRRLIAQGKLEPVALDGVTWTDVDTPEDFARAASLLGHRASPRAAAVA